jgi:hypothetical protein
MKTFTRLTLLTLVLHSSLHMAAAQGTAFNYQGLLDDGSGPVTGQYNVAFTIWTAASGPSQVGGAITNSLMVSNGLLAVTLDFGPGIFTGPDRWLEIRVRTNGAAAFVTLSPRQKLLAVPYAITAGNLTGQISSSGIAGTYSNPVAFNNAANSFSGNGAGLANVNAVTLGGLGPTAFWQLTGNTVTANQFLGSVNNQPLTLKVNNVTALQITPGTTLPNIVAGTAAFRPSVVASGVSGAVIAGGNAPSGGVSGFGGGDFHAVYDNDGTVSGGFGNKVGSSNGDLTDAAFGTVSGGVFNAVTNYAGMVGGGDGNLSGGSRAVVAGGYGNWAIGDFSAVGGGQQNVINPGAHRSTISGGELNVIQADATHATIAGGYGNLMKTNVPFGTIGGGGSNTITSLNFIIGAMWAPTIAGGFQNIMSNRAQYASIGGGLQNGCGEVYGVVAGGYRNVARGPADTIGGGSENTSAGGNGWVTIAGGFQNFGGQSGSTVGGGLNNTSSGVNSTVGGGSSNRATNSHGTVSGGRNNVSGGIDSVVPGGVANVASGRNSYAAGYRAKATHDGSYVWADLQEADFNSSFDNTVAFRCGNGVRFTDGGAGGVNRTVSWAPGSASWSFSSDRALKEGVEAVDGAAVLEKLVELPISEWNYKGYPQRHIGPMAQDFQAAFPLNESTTTLNEADLHGVALAAIQGLNQKLEQGNKDKDAEIQNLKQDIAELKKLVGALSQRQPIENK